MISWKCALVGATLTMSTQFAAFQCFATEIQFSAGPFDLPQTISPVPTGFGPSGSYAIAAGGGVYLVDASGRAANLVGRPGPVSNLNGGTFVPPGYGPLSGQFLVAGGEGRGSGGKAFAISRSGTATPIERSFRGLGVTPSDTIGQFGTPTVAPSGFGTVGGQVLISADTLANTGIIYALPYSFPIGSNAPLTTVAKLPISVFGLGFAPSDFGNFAGNLLATSAFTGDIYAVDGAGNVRLFASLALPDPCNSGQNGLRQFAFAPKGYGTFGGDLFVSVSASQFGDCHGDALGHIAILDQDGNLAGYENAGTLTSPLDPRGLYFADSSTLLVSNADPEIDILTPSSFSLLRPIPEPGSLLILLTCLTFWALLRVGHRSDRELAANGPADK